MKVERPATRIRSVSRAATALELIAQNGGGISATEIATKLEMPLPTAYHLLNTLTDVGLLDKPDDRRYQLGPKVGLLAEAFAAQLSAPEHLLSGCASSPIAPARPPTCRPGGAATPCCSRSSTASRRCASRGSTWATRG